MSSWDSESADSLLDEVRRALASYDAAANPGERRHCVAAMVRNLTRLWAELNPALVDEAWYAVSYMVESHWSDLVAQHEWAVAGGGADGWSNPWRNFQPGEDGSMVHPADARFVAIYQGEIGSKDPRHELVVGAWPEPWVGPVLSAPVLVLGANPGWAEGSDVEVHNRYSDLFRTNLTGAEPNIWLRAELEDSPGGRWYRNSLLKDVLGRAGGVRLDNVASRLAYVDLHGYHSRSWHAFKVTVPTQQATFELVRRRLIDERVVVIISRCGAEWRSSVPELADHPHVYAMRSTQQVRLSPGNLPSEGWAALVAALLGTESD